MSDQTADALLADLLIRRGHVARAGWKVALNAPAVLARLQLSRPLAAPLFSLEVLENGAQLTKPGDMALHVEAELALRLKSDIMLKKSLDELHASIESYAPCLELVDYALPRDGLPAMFAHSFFHAGVVLGEWQSADLFEPLALEVPVAVTAEGRRFERQRDSVPGNVVEALAGLVTRVLDAGAVLRAGEIVLCGSYIEPVPLPAGASVTVSYGLSHAPLSVSRSARV